MEKLITSLFLIALISSSCTGAVVIPGIALFGMQQETRHMEHNEAYGMAPTYANFDEVDHEMQLQRLRAEWNNKYEQIRTTN